MTDVDDDEVYEIDLRFDLEPASVQSSKLKKDAFATVVRDAAQKYPFIIVDDVRITIDWMIHEGAKYESDRKADVDNIVKPLFDSLCGPDGLLVDDTMIQSFHCGWIDHTLETDILHVRISSVKSESISEIAMDRHSLVFVEVDPNLYFPMDNSLPGDIQRIMLQSVAERFPMRKVLRELTGSYYPAQMIMPIQRLFHRSRIVRFPNFPLADYLNMLPPVPTLPSTLDSNQGESGPTPALHDNR